MRAMLWVVALLLVPGGAAAAHGYWRGGVFMGVAPHAVPYGHSHQPPPVAGEGCYAGPYVCPLDRPAVVGEPCGCPTAQGTAWGRAR